jgi:hypothetical protein
MERRSRDQRGGQSEIGSGEGGFTAK